MAFSLKLDALNPPTNAELSLDMTNHNHMFIIQYTINSKHYLVCRFCEAGIELLLWWSLIQAQMLSSTSPPKQRATSPTKPRQRVRDENKRIVFTKTLVW